MFHLPALANAERLDTTCTPDGLDTWARLKAAGNAHLKEASAAEGARRKKLTERAVALYYEAEQARPVAASYHVIPGVLVHRCILLKNHGIWTT